MLETDDEAGQEGRLIEDYSWSAVRTELPDITYELIVPYILIPLDGSGTSPGLTSRDKVSYTSVHPF